MRCRSRVRERCLVLFLEFFLRIFGKGGSFSRRVFFRISGNVRGYNFAKINDISIF